MASGREKRKTAGSLTPEVTERIIAASLAHPDFGPQRLARLLSGEGQPVFKGSVYKALLRRGLQNREQRLRFLEKQRRMEAPAGEREPQKAAEPSAGPVQEQLQASPEPAVPEKAPGPPEALAQETPPAPAEGKPERVSAVPAPGAAPRIDQARPECQGNNRWLFRGVNILLAALITWFGLRIGVTVYDEWQKPVAVAAGQPAPDSAGDAGAALLPGRPLSDYHTISDRNLFGTAKTSRDAAWRDTGAVDKIPAAEKNLGLRLIGTVVAEDPLLSYAVIDVAANREQAIFRERERVGKAVIRRILRNTVIIQTDAGQWLRLIVEDDAVKTTQSMGTPLPGFYGPPARAPGAPEMRTRAITSAAPDGEVASLMDPRRIIDETPISQHMDASGPGGLRIDAVSPGNPLVRIGLQSEDVVRAVNDKKITGPHEAEALFQTLAQDGDHTLLIERRGQMLVLEWNAKLKP
jgi:type II secretion system protein C